MQPKVTKSYRNQVLRIQAGQTSQISFLEFHSSPKKTLRLAATFIYDVKYLKNDVTKVLMKVWAAAIMRAHIFLVLLHLVGGISGNFIIYGTGTGEIRIKRVKTKETIKSIKIQVDEIKGKS